MMYIGMQGFLRLQTINKFSGKITSDTGFFPNTILTSGREQMAQLSSWMTHCQVGTDNTAPSQLDTSLAGHFAGTAQIEDTTNGQTSSAPYYGWKRRRYRFAEGTVAANLSEAGIGWGLSGSTLISRALILDPVLQTPTTVTPLVDELLDVTYELRYYPPLIDVNGPQITLDGVVYDTITRAASITGDGWSVNIGSKIGVGDINYWTAYDGNIGTVLTGPSGTSVGIHIASSLYNSAYVSTSYETVINAMVNSLGWNLGVGIRSVRIRTTAGDFQTQFNAAVGGATIPKTSLYTMQMAWTLGWTEKT